MKRVTLSLLLGLCPLIALAAKPGTTCDPRKFGDVMPRECTSPSLADQQAEQDQKAKREAEARAVKDRKREEGQLLERYPDETSLRAQRIRELEPIRARLIASWRIESQLAGERKTIDSELLFYLPLKPVPPKVQGQVDDNAGRFKVQRDVNELIDGEIDVVNAKFDNLRARMRPLWAARSAK